MSYGVQLIDQKGQDSTDELMLTSVTVVYKYRFMHFHVMMSSPVSSWRSRENPDKVEIGMLEVFPC